MVFDSSSPRSGMKLIWLIWTSAEAQRAPVLRLSFWKVEAHGGCGGVVV